LHGLHGRPAHQLGALLICGNPERQLTGCPLISCLGSSRRWLTAPGWCRGPGSGVSPDRAAAGGPGRRRRAGAPSPATEKITSADQVWCMIAPSGMRPGRGLPGVRRAPLLIWVLGPEPGSGDKMAIGVSRQVAAARSWSAVQPGPAATGLPGADRGFIGLSGATRSPGVPGGRR
jgi:hypothetical protein